jgi:hypothetical protein
MTQPDTKNDRELMLAQGDQFFQGGLILAATFGPGPGGTAFLDLRDTKN